MPSSPLIPVKVAAMVGLTSALSSMPLNLLFIRATSAPSTVPDTTILPDTVRLLVTAALSSVASPLVFTVVNTGSEISLVTVAEDAPPPSK